MTGSPLSDKGTNVWISFTPCTALPSGTLPKGKVCKDYETIKAQMETYRVNITMTSDEYKPDTLTQES